MITRDAPELGVSRQCTPAFDLAGPRSIMRPGAESPASLALMRRIAELFMKYPFYGSRQMVRQLRRDGDCTRPSGFAG